MSEVILKALMQLFAIIVKQDFGISTNEREYVLTFLKSQLNENSVQEYLKLFDEFVGNSSDKKEEKESVKLTSVKDSVKTLGICKKINKTLSQKQKVVVLVRLLEMINCDKQFTSQRMAIIDTVGEAFNISKKEFDSIVSFVVCDDVKQFSNPDILIIKNNNEGISDECKYIEATNIKGHLLIIRVPGVDLYFIRYVGTDEILLNGFPINDNRVHIFASGSIVKPPKGKPGFYTDVVQKFIHDTNINTVSFEVNNVSYKFPNGKIGLRNINLNEQSGKLIGIMGSSGAGKTTLLNVLCGSEKPSEGKVLINGIDLHSETKKLKGIIGYVPQDDLLIEELTVYQNLFFNTKLVFRDFSKEQIHNKVMEVLSNLGLSHISHLKVGNALNKKISGGQRKRLNIGLELIREPAILFLDEPTSGLSSRDSENVMELLSELTIKGKLIFTVIHQPSSNIFKMFDSLVVIDVEGYPVYYGNPIESILYFKKHDNQINSDIGECTFCGNVTPESIFNIIEAKLLDDYGSYTDTRKVSPVEWYNRYEKFRSEKSSVKVTTNGLPETHKIPGWVQQLKTYFKRDLFSKLANTQYLIVSLTEAPLISFILAFILRYITDPESDTYIYRDNDNIMPYMFMCTIVAIFLGLMLSAEEIFKDRKILKREKFLNLSRSSYLFSKIGILFLLSAIQSILFVIVGNLILEINGMFFEYWLVFFSLSTFANILGLNISSAFDSAVTIYILIPFLIIPQMVLSGAMFSFDKINRVIGGGNENVPFLAEIMPSRWAFEALVVNQFANNDYQKIFYKYEKDESIINYNSVYLLPELRNVVEKFNMPSTNKQDDIALINNEIIRQKQIVPSVNFNNYKKYSAESFAHQEAQDVLQYIDSLQEYYKNWFIKVNNEKDHILTGMQNNPEKSKKFQSFYDSYYNKHLATFAKNTYTSLPMVRIGNRFVQKIDPVFNEPYNKSFFNFRTHFMAPSKHFMGKNYSTFSFNIIMLWFFSVLLYISLYFELIKKMLSPAKHFKIIASLNLFKKLHSNKKQLQN